MGAWLTILIGVSSFVGIDRLEQRADRMREGRLLLAQVENAAGRQTLETLNILASGRVAGEPGNETTEDTVERAIEEIDGYGSFGLRRLDELAALGADGAAEMELAVDHHALRSQIAIALDELQRGDPNAAYLYGVRRIRPTFEVLERHITDLSLRLGTDADRADLWALIGGVVVLLAVIVALSTLRRQLHRERRRAEERMEHEVLHDPLTGLPNRRLFEDRLEKACAGTGRGLGAALMLLDLDGFKEVNDSLGHDVGDRLLARIAERLQSGLRAGDTVARVGGDEFAVVLIDVSQPVEVVSVAERIMTSLALPFDLGASTTGVGASIGIAIHEPTESPEALCARTNAALDAAKGSGRGSYCIAAGSRAQDDAPALGRVLMGA
ncbi:MAG: diguanylate cyclase domain-containing protein [Actinomycetota bacterium]